MPFVHLHTHSDYSLLDGAAKVKDLVKRTAELGMSALALTDHGNLFGAIDFYLEATKAGLKPVIGVELYMAPGSRRDKSASGQKDTSYHLLLLAKDQTGYRNLIRLSSRAYTEGFYYKPRIDWELLPQYSAGLICLTSCLKGRVPHLLIQGRDEEAYAEAARLKDLFGEDFFFELQNHGIEEETAAVGKLVALGRQMGVRLAATNDVHYLLAEHAEAQDVLLCIQSNKTLAENNRLKFSGGGYHLKSPQEMADLFPGMPEALAVTAEIADRCDLKLNFGTMHFPQFPIPAAEGAITLDDFFEKNARAGFQCRYPEPTDEARARLDHEIAVIRKLGFSGYFLIVKDFVDYARNHGIPVGPGRGSAAGSLVSYCLGITNLDPLRYQLLFERFLNPERVSPPDIDIDFADTRRGEVIEYVKAKYGAESVTQIITFGKMLAKAVVRDVGRVLGLPYGEVDRLAKAIPPTLGMTLERALEESGDFKALVDSSPIYQRLVAISRVLEGVNRNASTHAAGVVIAPGDLMDYVPLFRASETGETTTQWDMKWLDAVGLLKIDFLGLRTLTVIQDTLAMLHGRGVEINLEALPLDDAATFKLFGEKGTVGIFQFESSGMKESLAKLGPERLEDLIAMNALYRPGPMEMIDTYIARKHGHEQIEYLHDSLRPILEETYGIIVYQEQVIQIASQVAGFSLGKADILRRAMGKKKLSEMQKMKVEFVAGAVARGVAEKIATDIYDLIEKFASYGFNKSHAAGYALVAYQTAYLKVHYPAEFMAASLTSEMSNTDRITLLIEECRRLKIPLLPPCVNRSQAKFTVEDGAIRFGLGAVKNVGLGAIELIVRGRETYGDYRTVFDLAERVDTQKVNRKVLESLIMAGACDGLEGHRAQMKAALDDVLRFGQAAREDRDRGQASLFGEETDALALARPALPLMEEWSQTDVQVQEKEALGFFFSAHPLEAYRLEIVSFSQMPLADLEQAADGQTVRLAGYLTEVKKLTDKKGRTMAFVTLADFGGTVEALFFADTFEKCAEVLIKDAPLVVEGRCSTRENEPVKVLAEDAYPLATARSRLTQGIEVILDRARTGPDMAARLERLCVQHPGSVPLFLRLRGPGDERRYRSDSIKLQLADPLLQRLETLVGAGNVRLVAAGPKFPEKDRNGPRNGYRKGPNGS
ncbi:MAG: DNA polymerase III subunit alpha [Candidatus Zixiibacteriota bacterium]|nr:MAG: DNA polymerase III subunit alpha [candidate division Zixibacteria bacterium]